MLSRHLAPVALSLVLAGGLTGCFGPRPVADSWPDGTPRRHGQRESGKQMGRWTYWYANGKRQAEGDWANDKQTGPWTWWYPDGSPQHRGGYATGMRTGTWEHFHPGGGLAATGSYADDRQEGRWRYLEPDGTVRAEGHFDRGVKQGPWLLRSAGGRWDLGLYLAGTPAGPWATSVGGVTSIVEHPLPAGHTLAWAADHRSFTITGPTFRAEVAWPAADGAVTSAITLPSAGRKVDATLTPPGPLAPPPPVAAAPAPATESAPAPAASPVPAASPATAPVSLPPEPVAVSPIPVQPDVLSAKERESAATLIRTYTHGRDAGGDAYGWDEVDQGKGDPQGKALVGKALPQTRFLTSTGSVLDLEDATRPTVVVVMRGFSGQVCVYCATQTTAIANNLDRFKAAGADVLIIYPGPTESVPAFIEAIQALRTDPPPMPIGLDVSLLLVRGLGVESNLAKPTSMIIQPGGRIAYAYVGASIGDRPSVDDLINALRKVGK